MTERDAKPNPPKRTFFGDFRVFFVKGLGILLPSILTIGLMVWAFNFLKVNVAEPINGGARFLIIRVVDDVYGIVGSEPPAWYTVTEQELLVQYRLTKGPAGRELSDAQLLESMTNAERAAAQRTVRRADFKTFWNQPKYWYLEAIGFFIAIVAIYLAGISFGNLIGRRVYSRLEYYFVRLPIVKQVYPNIKQITDFLVGDSGAKKAMPGSKVVLVEYPRRGIWTIGLLTGASMDRIEAVAGCRLTTVFIPSSPTPFTGYTINVPEDEIVEVDISMDEAIRFVVSGGVLVPPDRLPERYRVQNADVAGLAPKGGTEPASKPALPDKNQAEGQTGASDLANGEK